MSEYSIPVEEEQYAPLQLTILMAHEGSHLNSVVRQDLDNIEYFLSNQLSSHLTKDQDSPKTKSKLMCDWIRLGTRYLIDFHVITTTIGLRFDDFSDDNFNSVERIHKLWIQVLAIMPPLFGKLDYDPTLSTESSPDTSATEEVSPKSEPRKLKFEKIVSLLSYPSFKTKIVERQDVNGVVVASTPLQNKQSENLAPSMLMDRESLSMLNIKDSMALCVQLLEETQMKIDRVSVSSSVQSEEMQRASEEICRRLSEQKYKTLKSFRADSQSSDGGGEMSVEMMRRNATIKCSNTFDFSQLVKESVIGSIDAAAVDFSCSCPCRENTDCRGGATATDQHTPFETATFIHQTNHFSICKLLSFLFVIFLFVIIAKIIAFMEHRNLQITWCFLPDILSLNYGTDGSPQ